MMKRTALIPFLSAALLSFVAAVCAQTTTEGPITITTNGIRPMMEVCDKISDLFSWRVSFEDGPVSGPDELTTYVQPNGRPRLIMRSRPVSFELPAMGNETVEAYRAKVMNTVIHAYAASGNRVTFSYTDDGEHIHVFPSAVAGVDGKVRTTGSILSTKVNVPPGTYTVGDLVSAILSQVATVAGTPIELATVPPNLFAFQKLTEEVNDKPAAEALDWIFEEINNPRYAAGVPPLRFRWVLTYVPDYGPIYFFNLSGVEPELDNATVADLRQHKGVQTRKHYGSTFGVDVGLDKQH
jgi:hypothetical protein